MLCVNALLFVRDILPGLVAGDPPRVRELNLQPGDELRTVAGLYDSRNRRFGENRTLIVRIGKTLTVTSDTRLDLSQFPGMALARDLEFKTVLTYLEEGVLDSLNINVYGLPLKLRLEGERTPPSDFPCRWTVGEDSGSFILDAHATRALSDALKPFEYLPELFVGRTWRLELFNPLAALVPDWQPGRNMNRSVLVRVVAQETIQHNGKDVEVFRVEADRVTAWVTSHGRVLRQEVELPIVGKLSIVDETEGDPLSMPVRRSGEGRH